jgi:hypothetical protein
MAILMGALLTLVWIAGFAMCERSPVQQSGMKTGNERLDQPSVRRWLIRPMQWLLEKSGILDPRGSLFLNTSYLNYPEPSECHCVY